MAVKLNRTAFDFAKELIVAGRFVFDEREAWSEHRPSAQTENEFLAAHVLCFAAWIRKQPLSAHLI